MGFAWDTHMYKDQKSQWHRYGGLINVTQSGGRTIFFTKDWMGLLWENGRTGGRTKLSNGAVSPLKNN